MLKGNSGETLGGNDQSCKGSFHFLIEYTTYCEQIFGRNVNDKGHFDDMWIINEAYVTG